MPDQLPITNMVFQGKFYNAGGFFNSAGTLAAFDPAATLEDDPNNFSALGEIDGRKFIDVNFDPLTVSGNIFSFDHFNANPWEGAQQTPYLTNADKWAYVYDVAATPRTDPLDPTSPA